MIRSNSLPIRLMREVNPRVLWQFIVGAGINNMLAFKKFKQRLKKGLRFPPIVFISVTQRCNLSCKGCWATGVDTPQDMNVALLDKIIRECATQGVRFFGLLGGEPLLLPWLPDFLKAHPKAYFQLFTNGRFLNESMAQKLAEAGNVTPLISMEGVGASYQARRGQNDMYASALDALDHCSKAGLVTGVATSVSMSNFSDTTCPEFIDEMVARGAHYVWYYIYRPSGPNPGFEEVLTDQQVRNLRTFILEQRKRVTSAVIIDAYWDEEGRARCPAAAGINLHINATGDVEPCPPLQCSDCHINMTDDLVAKVEQSALFDVFQSSVPKLTSGCVLMDHPKEFASMATQCHAVDSSGRNRFYAELASRPTCTCHNHSGDPLPETSYFYRMMKKTLFLGFGSYG
ncbi:MAG: radical SAM/SPASM domain-containing protein [bacterium]